MSDATFQIVEAAAVQVRSRAKQRSPLCEAIAKLVPGLAVAGIDRAPDRVSYDIKRWKAAGRLTGEYKVVRQVDGKTAVLFVVERKARTRTGGKHCDSFAAKVRNTVMAIPIGQRFTMADLVMQLGIPKGNAGRILTMTAFTVLRRGNFSKIVARLPSAKGGFPKNVYERIEGSRP